MSCGPWLIVKLRVLTAHLQLIVWSMLFLYDVFYVWWLLWLLVFTVSAAGLISFTVLFYCIFLTTVILLYIFYADSVCDSQCYSFFVSHCMTFYDLFVLFVSLSVGYTLELCKNGWTNWDAIWDVDLTGPREPFFRWGYRSTTERGNFGGFHFIEKHFDFRLHSTGQRDCHCCRRPQCCQLTGFIVNFTPWKIFPSPCSVACSHNYFGQSFWLLLLLLLLLSRHLMTF